ncbi:putative assembly protein [Candidatus Arcanobacter lacustris]|uniref:Putative assembly protein n=1 Tax=Candidatus Arcanibacter lacustris TaxID=1607817 RepID=A0A0F5MP67_9RICK|nr:putative assembly protein [Candidatus Arcanobacter lacustris]
MRFLKLSLFILLPITILLIGPILIKWNNYKEHIISNFKEQTGYDLVINGDVRVSFIPFCKIKLADIKIIGNNNEISSGISSDFLEIKLNPLYLVKNQLKILSLQVINGDIVIADHSNNKSNFNDILQNIGFLSNIGLDNSTISYFEKNNIIIDKFKLQDLSLDLKKDNTKLTFSSNPFDSKELILTKLSIDPSNNIVGNIQSDIINSSFNGIITQTEGNYQFNGKINSNIINLNKLLTSFFSNKIITSITSTESGSLSSDIIISHNQANFNNIIFQSDSLKTSGNFESNFASKSIINLDLAIDKLNLDNLYQKQNTHMGESDQLNSSEKQALDKLMSSIKDPKSNINIEISDNVDLLAILDIRNITYNNKVIKKAEVSLELHKKIMDLYYANIDLDDYTNLSISGILSSNKFRPIFNGMLEIKSKDLNSLSSWLSYDLSASGNFLQNNISFKSSVSLTPQQVSLGDIGGMVKEYPIKGGVTIKFDKDLPQITLELDVAKMNLDKLNISNIEQAKTFANNIQTRSDLLNKISWLRLIDAQYSLAFNFNELIAYENTLKDLTGSISLLPGSIILEDITVNNEKNSLIADLMLNIKTLNPLLNININGDSLHLDNVSNYFWSEDKVKLPQFNWFDGKILANLANLSIGNLAMKDFKADLKMGDQILYINDISSKIFDGTFDLKGSLVIERPTIGLSFSFVNVMAEQLLAYFPNMDNIAGYLSFSGSIASEGNNKLSLIKNTQASISIATRELNIKNFDLLGMIKAYNDNNKLNNNGLSDNLLPYLSSGSTSFYSADGNLTMSAGIIEIPKLTLNNQRAAGVFSGIMDFASGTCSALSQISFFPSENSREVVLTTKMSGPISNLVKNITKNKDVIPSNQQRKNYKRSY